VALVEAQMFQVQADLQLHPPHLEILGRLKQMQLHITATVMSCFGLLQT
jgi:hypothetical protein